MTSETLVETIGYRGLNINIHYDFDPINPIDNFEMLGTMACWHSRYDLGHKQPKDDPDDFLQELANDADSTIDDRIEYWDSGDGWVRSWNACKVNGHYDNENIQKAINMSNKHIKSIIQRALHKHYIMLPLYLYDHSGITISTGPFSCPWDSGQIGWVYVSIKKVKEEYNWILLTKSRKKKIIDLLKNEVELYDQYLRGDVYGYEVEDQIGNHIDSCWGFYGGEHDKSGLLEYAHNAADCHLESERIECMKAYQEEIGEMLLAYC